MTLNKDVYIEELVFSLLEDILLIPKSEINITDRIVKDLKMDSDDASFMFVPELEKKLEFKIPDKEWSKARTVEDVIYLLKRHKIKYSC